ncbi:MAG: cytidine deaminase [Clostridia bacterium]|nr:cytidine deaminase [Clostridia bacterium]
MTPEKLVEMAIEARKSAYAPYSGYRVGAALLGKSGKVYLGCNIENASYTPTVCAERVAVFKAVSEGEKEFEAIAVCGGNKDEIEGGFPPCGVCRQVLREFCDPDDFKVYMIDKGGAYKTVTLAELLPYGFGPDFLK